MKLVQLLGKFFSIGRGSLHTRTSLPWNVQRCYYVCRLIYDVICCSIKLQKLTCLQLNQFTVHSLLSILVDFFDHHGWLFLLGLPKSLTVLVCQLGLELIQPWPEARGRQRQDLQMVP